jgi:hypothetical protein
MRIATPHQRTEVPAASWYRSAALDERLRLFTGPSIAGFFAAMCVALWLALPGASLSERLAQSGRGDPLTVAYLRAWLAAEPGDLPLHLSLARRHLGLGDWDRAMAALAVPIERGDPALRREAQWLKLEVLEQRAFAAPVGSEARTEAWSAMRAQLRVLAGLEAGRTPDPVVLEALSRRAHAAGDGELALELIDLRARALAPAGTAPDAWLARLAGEAESLGAPLDAARLRWRAFDAARDEAARRAHFFAAVRLMQSADRTAQALDDAIARFDRLQPDTGLWRFMVRLAMAAGRPDLADRFAREMLRFALLEQWRALLDAESAPVLVPAALDPRGARPRQPQLPFDDPTYLLAYDVFLANGNLADAYEVAASAVRQAPADLDWRRRLAQVAQWTGRGEVALEQWLHLARAEGTALDWERVETLAAQIGDGAVLLEALRRRALATADPALDLRVAQLLEDRGDPRAAIDWLAGRIERHGPALARSLVERQIVLHESLDDDPGLLAWLDRADAAYGVDPVRALRRAALHVRTGDSARAFAALGAARAQALRAPEPPALPGSAETFWHLWAELAQSLQREDEADFAYRQLLRAGRADAAVLGAWGELLEPRSTRAAAWVAEHAWHAHRRPEDAERAFALWLQLGDFAALERIGRDMDPVRLAALRREPVHLQALATHLQAQGDPVGARRALEQALAASPSDAGLRASLIWLLLEQKQAVPLRAALERGAAQAERDKVLWGPYAAAWMALDEPQRALRWYVRQMRAGAGDDYLWQLGYADCLEQNGLVDSAWAVRRRAWLELRAMPAGERDARPWRRQATVTLALRFAPADAAREALRALIDERETALAREQASFAERRAADADAAAVGPTAVASMPGASVAGKASPATSSPGVGAGRRTEGAELEARVDAALAQGESGEIDEASGSAVRITEARGLAAGARELGLSDLLSREASDAARAWLLSRYASQLSRPAWAQLSIALATDDREALAALLDDLPDWLPRMEQADAMRSTGRVAQAQTVAWSVATERPALEDAHRRLVDLVLPDASFALVEASGNELGALGVRTLRAQLQHSLRPGIAVGLVLDRDRMRSLDETQLVGVPEESSRVGATLRWRGDSKRIDAELTHFSAVRDRVGLSVALRPQPDPDRGPSLALGLRQVATESAPLRAGGMRDFVEARWGWPITVRDRVAASVAGVRLASQDGTTLATGSVWTLEASHRLRVEYPDLAVKVVAIRSDWNPRAVDDTIVAPLVPPELGDPTAAVVPVSSTEVAAGVSFGDTVAQTYSRALRPFGEALLRSNSVSGGGYSLRAGVTASLFGSDRLSAFLSLLSRTPGLPRGSRAFGLAYQVLF